MNTLLLIGSGMFIGAALTLLWALDKIEECQLDADLSRRIAADQSRRLAEAGRSIERLTEQVGDLLSDPADAWREPR